MCISNRPIGKTLRAKPAEQFVYDARFEFIEGDRPNSWIDLCIDVEPIVLER